MEERAKVIRNPTIEEIQRNRESKVNKNVIQKEVAEDLLNKEEASKETPKVKLKTKTSIFEPNPFPYKLITTNNVVKDNLTDNHEIYVRRMSGEDDIILQKMISVEEHVVVESITKILTNCIKTDIDVKNLPLMEKIPLFLFILAISTGEVFDASPVPDCTTCDINTKVPVSIIKDFKTDYMQPNDPEYPKKFLIVSYNEADIEFEIVMPRIGGESTFMKEAETKIDYLNKLSLIISKIAGYKPDGSFVEAKDYAEIINFLNDDDKMTIKKIQDEWVEKFGTIYKTTISTCTNSNCCKKGQEVEFRPYDIIRKFILKTIKEEQK